MSREYVERRMREIKADDLESLHPRYWRITGDFRAVPTQRDPVRCAAIVKGWRAHNYQGDVPKQCSRNKTHGEYCAQHWRENSSDQPAGDE